jgi:hypothetical protein
MATKTKGKGAVVALAEQLIAGTNKHLASTTQIMVAGGSFTATQVIEKLQSLVKLRTDVDAAKASTQAKLVAEKTDMAPLRTFMGAFVAFLKAAYPNSPDVLADFGLHPRKSPTPLTADAKAAAAAKRKATRAARHVMGSKQRTRIKGDVTGVTVTPVVAAPTATEPTGPSAPATSGGASAGPTPPHTT